MHLKDLFESRWLAVAIVVCLVTLAITSPAMASVQRGVEFAGLWERVTDYLTGVPGIIAAASFIIMGLWSAFGRGSVIGFFGGILAAATIFLIPTIVEGMGGAIF